jgi:transcription initiation factor TFIIA small subunit
MTHYGATILGKSLHDTLSVCVGDSTFSAETADEIMNIFYRCIHAELEKCSNTVTISGKIHTYRSCDKVWTIMLQNATIELTSRSKTIMQNVPLTIIALPLKEITPVATSWGSAT